MVEETSFNGSISVSPSATPVLSTPRQIVEEVSVPTSVHPEEVAVEYCNLNVFPTVSAAVVAFTFILKRYTEVEVAPENV